MIALKIIFMGTPDFAAVSLEALLSSSHQVLAVVSQPDKPVGRGKKIKLSPVKEKAIAANIPVLQPEKAKDPGFIEELKEFQADIFVVAAYGKILPEAVLNLPPYGCVNVHGSLLPKYRGAAPIQWAIINGEEKTGVTIMQMNKGMDTGDMILKRELPIQQSDTGGSLYDKMAALGAEALLSALQSIEEGAFVREKQDDSMATYAPMLTKETGHIDWSRNSKDIVNLIRGLNPWPAAYTLYEGEPLKIWEGEALSQKAQGAPGQILNTNKNGILTATGDGAILLTRIQARGGKAMAAADYIRGHTIEEGRLFS